MKTPMKIVAAIVLVMAGAAYAAAADVTGTWTMSVKGGPHGDATMGLVLEQEGTRVTGTFSSGHAADMAVSGAFEDNALKLETSGDDHAKIVFSAKLKADGTLAGYVSSPMGDMTWTAARADRKKDGK
jgi:hypothetical protein